MTEVTGPSTFSATTGRASEGPMPAGPTVGSGPSSAGGTRGLMARRGAPPRRRGRASGGLDRLFSVPTGRGLNGLKATTFTGPSPSTGANSRARRGSAKRMDGATRVSRYGAGAAGRPGAVAIRGTTATGGGYRGGSSSRGAASCGGLSRRSARRAASFRGEAADGRAGLGPRAGTPSS